MHMSSLANLSPILLWQAVRDDPSSGSAAITQYITSHHVTLIFCQLPGDEYSVWNADNIVAEDVIIDS